MQKTVIAVALLAALGVQAAPDLCTFCEVWSQGVYGVSNASNQYTFTKTALNLAIHGQTMGAPIPADLQYAGWAADAAVRPYFDGNLPAGSTNFTDPANTAQLDALHDSLTAYFLDTIGCRAAVQSQMWPYEGPSNMNQVHSAMAIGINVWVAFNTILGKSLAATAALAGQGALALSFGDDPLPTNAAGYFQALTTQFLKSNSSMSICTGATCPAAQKTFSVFTQSSPAAFVDAEGNTNNAINITMNPGDAVVFSLGATHTVTQVASADATTALANGWGYQSVANPPAPRLYTFTATTPGMYYYVCLPHVGVGMRGWIHVLGEVPAPSAAASPASALFAVLMAAVMYVFA